MRVAINLLTEDPQNPSGAHWFWTRVIPEMAKILGGWKPRSVLSEVLSRRFPPLNRALGALTWVFGMRGAGLLTTRH
jgi:hypothetical protein